MSELGRLALSEEWPEVWQDFLRDDLIHLAKGVSGNRQIGSSGLKANVQGHVGVQITLRTISGHPSYYCAFAKRAEVSREVRGPRRVSISGSGSGDGPVSDAHGGVVFVGVPHLMEQDESVAINRIGSAVVRLMTFKGLDNLTSETFEARFREFVEGRPISAYQGERKTSPPGVRRSHAPNEVVEKRAQVVYEIGGDESEDRWYRLMFGDLEDIAFALRIRFGKRGIRIKTHELSDLNVEVIEVKLRSLQPPFKVVQIVTLGGVT